MPKLYLVSTLLLLAGWVAAQAPAPRTPPTTYRTGTYQLAAGPAWRHGKLLYNDQSLSVSDADHKPREPLVYPASEVQTLAIGRDTFEVVHELDVPKPAQHLRSTFARRLYRKGGFQVAEFVAYLMPPETPLVYMLLLRPSQPAVLLPANRIQFRLALAKTLHDYPALAQQLELDPNILPEQLPELLAAYGHWKASAASKQ